MVDSVTALERIFLQATLVKGQSGGPAVNAEGEVVAIAAYRDTGAQQSYLVPINDAWMVLAGLMPAAQGALVASASAPPPGGFIVSGIGGQAATVEEVEPNDHMSNANVVAMGATVTATVGNSEEKNDLFDHFIYRPEASDPFTAKAIVRGKGKGSQNTWITVSIYDENKLVLLEEMPVRVGHSLSVVLPARAAYLVKVNGRSFELVGGTFPDEWWMNYDVTLRPA